MQLKPGTPISLRVTGRTGQPRTVISADEEKLSVSNNGLTEDVSRDDIQEIAHDVTRRGSAQGVVIGAAFGFVLSAFAGRYSQGTPLLALAPIAGGALGSMSGIHVERVVLYRKASNEPD